jgi:predicted RNase H-like HicB family nuclease
MKEAVGFHLEEMQLHGERIPEPTTVGEEIEVAGPFTIVVP